MEREKYERNMRKTQMETKRILTLIKNNKNGSISRKIEKFFEFLFQLSFRCTVTIILVLNVEAFVRSPKTFEQFCWKCWTEWRLDIILDETTILQYCIFSCSILNCHCQKSIFIQFSFSSVNWWLAHRMSFSYKNIFCSRSHLFNTFHSDDSFYNDCRFTM